MKQGIRMALVISLAPTALAAQAPGPSVQQRLWHNVTTNITRAAEEMPEANYAFRPTPEVRTFGQLVGHIAGAQYMMCAASLSDSARAEDDIEKSRKTKAALVEALKASTAYCERAYTQTDSALAGSTQLFGENVSRMYALSLNTVHNGEHYGNIVTYLRIKGMVPPSSRR